MSTSDDDKENTDNNCIYCYRYEFCHLKRLRDFCGGPFKDYDEHKNYIFNEIKRLKK